MVEIVLNGEDPSGLLLEALKGIGDEGVAY
jgi:hypothetical protein